MAALALAEVRWLLLMYKLRDRERKLLELGLMPELGLEPGL